MIRPDLVFKRNRERLDDGLRRRRVRGGCLGTLAFLAALAVVGGWVFRERTGDWVRHAAPWLQSQGRAVAGKVSLLPFFAALHESDLSQEEKTEWTRVVETAWTVAEETSGAVVRRRDIIEPARKVLESDAGLYYGIRLLRNRGLDHTDMNAVQKSAGMRLMNEALDALENGRVTDSARIALNAHLPLLLIDLREGRLGERDLRAAQARLRDFLSVLNTASRAGAFDGESRPTDLAGDMRTALRIMGREIENAKKGERQ